MDSSKDGDLELETPKRSKIDDSLPEDANDDFKISPGDKLCEDELTVIFRNSWLSTQNLLNLRLVSKSWRDAATTTLLQRNACVVQLYGDPNQVPPCFFKHRGRKTYENQLSQLTDLISSSPKFPSTHFRIQTSLQSLLSHTAFSDLLHFFELHGDKIKTLAPYGRLTAKCLLDILLIHSPSLESLDLRKTVIKTTNEEEGGEGNFLKWRLKAVPFKSFTLGLVKYYCQHPFHWNPNEDNNAVSNTDHCSVCNYRSSERELIRLLLSSPSKLGCIENVTLKTLRIVLEEEKEHLIRNFKYHLKDAQYGQYVSASQMTKFVSLNPKPQLSKVTLNLKSDFRAPAAILTSLNEFIESFKDTVQYLEISFKYYQLTWEPILKIPPMKKLKSFTLKLGTWRYYPVLGLRCNKVDEEEPKALIDVRGTLFQFQDGISAHIYFPSLMEVSLNSSHSRFKEVSPMSFFSFKSNADTDDGSAANWNCLPKVDILKIDKIGIGSRQRLRGTGQSLTETPLLSEVFPNIRILKFKCGKVSNLSSDLWTFCPNVEFMEIIGIESCLSDGRDFEKSQFVDKVFTGFSDQMLENLQRSEEGLSCETDTSSELKAPRSPSISDLRRLRELKLKFVGECASEFASSVTGVHAFSKMPNTKFIISYDAEKVLALNRDRAEFSYSDEGSEDNSDDSDDDSDEAVLQSSDNDSDDEENDDTIKIRSDWERAKVRNKIDGNIDGPKGSEENGDDKMAKYEELIFGAIKPYVHIVHEKQKWDLE